MEGCAEILSASDDSPNGEVDFFYPPLDYTKDPDAIRLLWVSPDLLDGYIQVDLRQAPSGTISNEPKSHREYTVESNDSKRPPEFYCLSYTWGAPSPVHEILLNGHVFPVRTNLFDFLNVARRLHASKTLWIDALCIDQKNVAERGHQVQRMDRIYGAAAEVLIWLGPSPALEHIAACLSRNEITWRLPASGRKHFVEVVSHPYWNRAWITQEILLAKSVQILYTSGTMSWGKFGSLLDMPYHYTFEDVRTIHFLASVRNYRSVSLTWQVLSTRQYETACTNKRDRLYSMLGLLNSGRNFLVDYEESLVDLFWRAGEHFRLWRCSRVDLLQTALDLSIQDLRKSLQQTVDRTVTLSLHYAYYGERQFPRRTGMTRCRHEKIELPYKGPYHHEVLFCTSVVIGGEFMRDCSHVLLSRASAKDSQIHFTLVTRAGDLFRSIKLQDTVLQTLSVLARRERKVVNTADEWLSITQWDDFWQRLRLDKKNRCSDRWELKMPARYIVEQLNFS